MRRLGIRGVVRGKKVITTNPDTSLPCPDDTRRVAVLWCSTRVMVAMDPLR